LGDADTIDPVGPPRRRREAPLDPKYLEQLRTLHGLT